MPKDRKVKVPHGTEAIDFTIPEEWFHKDDIAETHVEKSKFATELSSRVAEITKDKKTADELLSDEKFIERVAKEKKDAVLKVLNINPSRTDIDVAKITEEAMAQVRKDEVEPLKKQLPEKDKEIDSLRLRALDAQVAEACIANGVVGDLTDLVKLYVRERTTWDGDRKDWFVKKKDGSSGYEISTNPKSPHPWQGVSELLEKTKQSGEKKSWFVAGTQAGPEFKGGGGGGSGAVSLESFQKLSPAERTQFYRDHPTEYSTFMDQIRQSGESALFDKKSGAPTVPTTK
jgi:hypothetical protein